MRGALHPASSIRCLISGTAAAASGVLTVTRTISDPASASSTHCFAVAAASLVSVMVMLWTTTGAPPPTWTSPTRTPKVLCSLTGIAIDSIIRRPAGRGWSHKEACRQVDYRRRFPGAIIMRKIRTLTILIVLGLGATMLAQAVTEADL